MIPGSSYWSMRTISCLQKNKYKSLSQLSIMFYYDAFCRDRVIVFSLVSSILNVDLITMMDWLSD